MLRSLMRGTVFFCLVVASGIQAEEGDSPANTPAMTNQALGILLETLDPELKGETGNWYLEMEGLTAQIITDVRADRMRIMIPVAQAKGLNEEELYRLLQANFESALDARYAVAQGFVWSAYIHPLSTLTPQELVLAVAQTFNVASTYGSSYSSGLFQFGGGDNRGEAFDKIIERGTPL